MSEIFAGVPPMWQREMAALIWGGLLGAGFWIFGALAVGLLRVVFKDKDWWKNLLFFLVGLPFGTGVLPGIALFCGWSALKLAEQQPVLEGWVWLGFFFWPILPPVGWLLQRRKVIAKGAEVGAAALVWVILAVLGWTMFVASIVLVAGSVIIPHWPLLLLALPTAAGSWGLRRWMGGAG